MTYKRGLAQHYLVRVLNRLFITALIGIVIYAAFITSRDPEPANSKAFGCYRTSSAAPILLDEEGMTILQQQPLKIGFHLERGKRGIALTAEAPITAERMGTEYLYLIRPPGVGRYLFFFNESDGRASGVFDANALSQFKMHAQDGAALAYTKTALEECYR